MTLRIALICVLMALPALGEGGSRVRYPPLKSSNSGPLNAKCDAALKACQDLVTAQDLSIIHLKANVTTLQNELAASKANEKPMPTWMLVGSSILAGMVAGMLLAK